jgi:hypothetical protein
MEPTIQPVAPMQPPVQPAPQVQDTNIGSIIGIIVIIAVIILGGLYFWGKRVEEAKLRQSIVEENAVATQETVPVDEATKIKGTSQSDELNSIEADLNATNLEDLNPELDPKAI